MTKFKRAAKKIWQDLNDREILGDVMAQMEEEPGLKEEVLEEWAKLIENEVSKSKCKKTKQLKSLV
jgi:hypothetical protein